MTLMQIYEENVKSNSDYCKMCLRNGRKRKLVPPIYLSKLLDELSIMDQIQNIHVCYVCEARAKSALQFMANVTFAVSVDKIFQNMKINPSFRRDYTAHYNGKLHKKTSALLKLASECEEKLLNIQTQSQLQNTEVLIVDNQLNNENFNSQTHQQTAEKLSFDNVVILDDDEDDEIAYVGPTITPNPLPQNITIPTQVSTNTSDLIVKPPIPVHKLVSLAKLVENSDPTGFEAALINDTMQLLSRDRKQRNKFIIHPILHGIDGHLYIPSLPAKLVNGGLEHLPADEPIRVISQNQHVDMQAVEKAILNAMCRNSLNQNKNKEVLLSLDDLQKQIKENEELEKMEKRKSRLNNMLSNSKRTINEEGPDKRSRTETIELLDENNSKDVPEVSAVTESSMEPGPTPISIMKVPISKDGMIDFEDKIPMDIISFVDDQDQDGGQLVVPDNPFSQPQLVYHERLESSVITKVTSEPVRSEPVRSQVNEAPMGFITQIRTLSPTEMIGIDEEDKISCIDLC